LDQDTILDIVLSAAIDLTDTATASIFTYESSSNQIFLAASTSKELPENDHNPALEGSYQGWIIKNRQPLFIQDPKHFLPDYPEIEFFEYPEIENMIAVPLITKNQVIGILEVINKVGEGKINEQDNALLQVLASHAAAAVEHARLFQQTDLIADFMHEFKTPLMALTTASEILAREELIPFHMELLSMIQSETARLSRMAQDFLDLSRLESGRFHLNHEQVDLVELTEEVIKLQRPQIRKREINLKIEKFGTIVPVTGDQDRLKQVLLNLTGNAIKYNRIGGPITIQLEKVAGEMVIEITDTGPGIAEENIPHIFERFYRVRDEEGFTEGAGLGLPIAKRIIDNHGGRIEVYFLLLLAY
jgi:signal transduction histidine kinase